MIMLNIMMANVNRNSRLTVKAAFRSFFSFMARLVKPYLGDASSDVMRRMMAFTASNKLRSEKVKSGSCMVSPSSIW